MCPMEGLRALGVGPGSHTFGHSHLQVKQRDSAPHWSEISQTRSLMDYKNTTFFLQQRGPASRHQLSLPLPQSGPSTETCRNCENLLLSQVFRFSFFLFVCLFSGQSQPLKGLRRGEAGRKRNTALYI